MTALRFFCFVILMFALGALVAKAFGRRTVKVLNRNIEIGAIALTIVYLISIGIVIIDMYIEYNKW